MCFISSSRCLYYTMDKPSSKERNTEGITAEEIAPEPSTNPLGTIHLRAVAVAILPRLLNPLERDALLSDMRRFAPWVGWKLCPSKDKATDARRKPNS
jgi:hypothetical protein